MIVQGIPFPDYLAIEAASSHGLQTIAKRSPYAYRNAVDTPSEAMALGTLAHALILEPHRESQYAISPAFDRRTKAGKELTAQFEADCAGKTIVTREDWDRARGMRDAVWSRDHTRALLESPGQAESTVTLQHPDYGVPCKCRPDRITDGYPLIVDLKTAQSAGPRDFMRACWNYGYQGQAWFYRHMLHLETCEAHGFVFVVVESAPPHDVALYELSDRELAEGETVIRKGLDLYRRCSEAGVWPGVGWDWDSMSYQLQTIGRED